MANLLNYSGEKLVPTRVGMILLVLSIVLICLTCPHTRGDDPLYGKMAQSTDSLSPHAWG